MSTNLLSETCRALREIAVRGLAASIRPLTAASRRLCTLWWAAALRAGVRQVGPGVHLLGPVRLLGTRNVRLGRTGNIYDGVAFETQADGCIVIGDNFRINQGSVLSAHAGIRIGDGCLIGEYVSIRDHNHRFDDLMLPIGRQGHRSAPIRIGDDVWIGRGAAILEGVAIGRGAVIGANSVVTRDVPSMEVWAGVPARFIRRRSDGTPNATRESLVP